MDFCKVVSKLLLLFHNLSKNLNSKQNFIRANETKRLSVNIVIDCKLLILMKSVLSFAFLRVRAVIQSKFIQKFLEFCIF